MNRRRVFLIGSITVGIILIIFFKKQYMLKLPSKGSSSVDKQSKHEKPLFQYGILDAFINGAYKGDLTIRELKTYGDFGLGAPDLIDGELTLLGGKVYQTKWNGVTTEIDDSQYTPFAVVTSFRAQRKFDIVNQSDLNDLFKTLLVNMPHKNKFYAVKITGNFHKINARAFSPVKEPPYKPLSQLTAQQHIFKFENISGSMIGFYIPAYLSGINVSGFHFHFLSDDLKSGGHVIAMEGTNLQVELEELKTLSISVPTTPEFDQFQSDKANSRQVDVVEKGH